MDFVNAFSLKINKNVYFCRSGSSNQGDLHQKILTNILNCVYYKCK